MAATYIIMNEVLCLIFKAENIVNTEYSTRKCTFLLRIKYLRPGPGEVTFFHGDWSQK